MPRSLLLALIVLVAAPLVLLGWVTISAMQTRHREAAEQVKGLIDERLGEFDESISDMLQSHARRLQQEISGDKNPINALKEIQLNDPIARQGIFVSKRGLMLYPAKPVASDPDALALYSSLVALIDSRPVSGSTSKSKPDSSNAGARFDVQQQAATQSVKGVRQQQQRMGEPGTVVANLPKAYSQTPNGLSSNTLGSNALGSSGGQTGSISMGDGYSWQTWYMDEGAQLTFWIRRRDGSSVGVLLERSRWMSDVIASLPDSNSALSRSSRQVASPVGYTALVDETQRVLYQWGSGFEPEMGSVDPRVARPASAPLASWQLQYFSSAELVPTGSVAPVVLSLSGIGVLLLALGVYVMTAVQRQMLAARNRVSFAGQVSHELRTPLTNIRLYTELAASDLEKLSDRSVRESLGNRLDVIDRESRRLQRLVSGVLEMIRDGGKRVGVRRSLVNPNDVIRQLVEQFTPGFEVANIVTEMDLSTDREVNIDADVLEMVLINLLSNVEKYVGAARFESSEVQTPSADSGATLTATCWIRSRFSNDCLVVDVTDDGPGIAVSDRRRVFQPFSRLDDSISAPSGTGIGLTIAQRAARRHGGDLTLLPNHETTGARFSIPLAPHRLCSGAICMTLRILIAEDDPNTRAALAEVLRGEGYEAIEAADGRQAKDLFERQKPDIACLDVMMPGLSGYDLCKHFRQCEPRMPILFITAKSEEIDKVVGLELGGDDYIVKPFGTKEVIARIRAVTRRCMAPQPQANDDFPTDPFLMDDLEVIPKEYRVRRGESVIALTARELRILQCLAQRAGEVVPRNDLFRIAWEDDHVPNSRTIDQTISQLRKRIEKNPKSPRIIETVYGVGYRFQPS